MSSNNTTNLNKSGTKDDPAAPFKVGNQEWSGLDASTVDKTNPGLQNASGTSETRRGEDLKLPEKSGQGFTKEKTATESLVEGIEKRV